MVKVQKSTFVLLSTVTARFLAHREGFSAGFVDLWWGVSRGGPRVVYAFITGVHGVYGGSMRIYEGGTGPTGYGATGVIA